MTLVIAIYGLALVICWRRTNDLLEKIERRLAGIERGGRT